MARLTLKQIQANAVLPPSVEFNSGGQKVFVTSSPMKSDTLPKGVLGVNAEPWMHTIACYVDHSSKSSAFGSSGSTVGMILITYIWDTREVIDVTYKNYEDLHDSQGKYVSPLKNIKYVRGDNKQPLKGVTAKDIAKKLTDYVDNYVQIDKECFGNKELDYNKQYELFHKSIRKLNFK